mgnify:CR=1 FL=1
MNFPNVNPAVVIVLVMLGAAPLLLSSTEINPVLLIASLMVAATPLLLAAIRELVVERAGVLNLGV